MATPKPPTRETPSSNDDDPDDIEHGKPTITLENHAKNFGQREEQELHEGVKPTISSDNHQQNVGQRGGYHEHKA